MHFSLYEWIYNNLGRYTYILSLSQHWKMQINYSHASLSCIIRELLFMLFIYSSNKIRLFNLFLRFASKTSMILQNFDISKCSHLKCLRQKDRKYDGGHPNKCQLWKIRSHNIHLRFSTFIYTC